MILVSGTKRSGTSMWMQILRAAGYAVWGDAFPRDWGESIRAANPEGFFESPLRRGVYEKTNPDPRTGVYLAPHATQNLVVKVFARGLVRTERAFVGHVIASVRPIAEYVASMERLYAMERAHRAASAREGTAPSVGSEVLHMPAALEWWHHNTLLLGDARRRGYPLSLVSYPAVLRDPERVVGPVLRRLGPSNVSAALGSVQPSLRTQRAAEVRSLGGEFSPRQLAAFEALFGCVDGGQAPTPALAAELAAVGSELAPRIAAARAQLRQHRQRVPAPARLRRSA